MLSTIRIKMKYLYLEIIFGIKPLYYYQNKDVILFGSEIKKFF